MTSSGKAVVTLPTDKQILIEREFDAPKELVYKAYTTPELIKRWWAGKRGEVTLVEVDLRVGGGWRYVMNASSAASRSASTASTARSSRMSGWSRPRSTRACPTRRRSTPSTLTEENGRTKLSILVEHQKQEHRDGHIESGMEGGMQESMDALEEVAKSLG